MDPEQNKSGICFSYCSSDAVLAQRLITDLENIGCKIWINIIDDVEHGDTISELYRSFKVCDVFLPICSLDFINILSWGQLRQITASNDVHMIPLLVQSWDTIDWLSKEQTINFSNWRNNTNYKNYLEKLAMIIKVRFPALIQSPPDLEIQYINSTLANIQYYKSQLAIIGSRSYTLPKDKSAIYSHSMWGLTGEFEVIVEQDGETKSFTDTFYRILEDYPRLLLLGDAGVGKTTTLYRTTLDVLRAYKADNHNFPLPYLLHLNKWHENISFETFLQSHWPFENEPGDMLPNGNIFILLDGLDEIGRSSLEKIHSLKTWLHGKDGPKYVVIACDLESSLVIEDLELPHVILRELSLSAIRQYVLNYLDKSDSQNLLGQIGSDLTDDENEISHLANNLFNLAIMVSIIRSDKNAQIPKQQAQLLFWMINTLWSNQPKNPNYISFEEGFSQLSFFAFSLIDDNMASFVPYSYALNKINNLQIIQMALDMGLLWMDEETIGFRHSLFRDCCATYHLITEGIYTRLKRMEFSDKGQRIPWRWDRPIVFAAALADNPENIVRDVAEVNPYLALECIFSDIDVDYKTKKYVVENLVKFLREVDNLSLQEIVYLFDVMPNKDSLSILLEHLPFQMIDRDEDATMPLKKLGSNIVGLLIDILRGDKWERRKGAAWMLGELNVHAAIPGLIEALSDENESVRKEADYALARIGKPALPHLQKNLQSKDADLRANIIKVLGRIGSPSSVPDLIACLSDTSFPHREDVRICDLAKIALEYIGTEDALAAIDTWKESVWIENNNPEPPKKAQMGTHPVVNTATKSKSRKQLIEDLNNENWEVRRDAIQALGKSGDKSSLTYILNALNDEDNLVRLAAVKELNHFKGKDVLQGLITALHDEDYGVCDEAANALQQIGQDAAPALIETLSSMNINAKGNAAEVLGKIQSESAIPHLADMLEDHSTLPRENMSICNITLQALKNIGTTQAVRILEEWDKKHFAGQQIPIDENGSLLDKDELGQGNNSYNGYHEAADDDTQKKWLVILLDMLNALENSDWNNRQEITKALLEHINGLDNISDADIVSSFNSALENKNRIVRQIAIEALGNLGDEAIPLLKQALKDEAWTIRDEAIRSVLKIQNTSVIPDLVKLIHDQHHMVRQTAITALGELGDSSIGTHLIDILDDDDEFVRKATVEALGNLKYVDVVPTLLSILEDETIPVKLTVIEALGKIGSSKAIPVLEKYLKDESKPDWEEERRVCDIAAEALGYIDDPQAQAALEEWRVRQLR